MKEVYNYLKRMPVLLLVIMTMLIATFGASSQNVGIPLLAEKLGDTSLYQGLIWGFWGIGSLAITLILPKMKIISVHMKKLFFILIICSSLCFIVFLSQNSLWLILPFAFFTGIFDTSIGTIQSSIIQQTENSVRGRAIGVTHLLNRLGFFLGFVTVPTLLKVFSLSIMVSIMHGLVIVFSTISLLYIYKINSGKMFVKRVHNEKAYID